MILSVNIYLYLKKTFRDIIPSDMIYETILRANTTVFFAQGKTFTWLKRVRDRLRTWVNLRTLTNWGESGPFDCV